MEHGDNSSVGRTSGCDPGSGEFDPPLSPGEYWLAGILEGEGSFQNAKDNKGKPYPLIRLQMTDKDIVEKVAKMWAVSVVNGGKPAKSHWKQTYVTKVSGATAKYWIIRLYSLMGVRRRQQMDAALIGWNPSRKYFMPGEEERIAKAFLAGEKAHIVAERYNIRRETVYRVARRYNES